MTPRNKKYEALFLFGAASTVDVDGALKRVESIVTSHEGKVILLRKWDERRLAYEIKKQKRGLYILCFFEGPTTAVEKITRDVNLSEDILRVLVTDASHLSVEEMKAQEPQQPVREVAPGTGDRPPRREDGVPAGA